MRNRALVKTSTITIRIAQSTDAAFVVNLSARFADAGTAWRSRAEVIAGTERALAAAFDDPQPRDLVVIAERGDERVGFAFVSWHDDFFTSERYPHLSEIATVRDGEGIGSALLEHVERWARESGARFLSLNVVRENERGRAFYETRGFELEYRHFAKVLR